MKTCITTVFKTENCGSFLQSWALKEKLSSLGNNVLFVDYTGKDDSFKKKIISIAKCCLRLRFKRVIGIVKKTIDFKKLQKKLQIANSQDNDADAYFFGSDTLWNFNDAFFKNNASFFTGEGILTPCYAYSISIGSTSKEEFIKNEKAVKNIQKFKKIAVRDEHTEKVLSEIYPTENIIRTVDPTLLFDKETYVQNFSTKLPYSQDSLVIYYFGDIPNDTWKKIKEIAAKEGLKIINVGFYEKKFDENLVASPKNFITAFANAKYIFTNTFHGCVFSTIFNKQFATDGIHKKKIEGFLKEFSLLDRVITNSLDLEKVLTAKIDYDMVNKLVDNRRKSSIDFLSNVLNEEQKHE